MSDSSSKFVSLKFQVAGAFAFVASFIVLVFSLVIYFWSSDRQERYLVSEYSKFNTNFEQLVSMTSDHLVDMADQVMLLASIRKDDLSVHTVEWPESVASALEVHWENLNLFGEIDSMVLMDARGKVLIKRGVADNTPIDELLSWVPNKSRPQSLIYCSDDCRIYLGVPVLVKGDNRYILVITQSISDVISTMQRSFNVELALALRQSKRSYLGQLANWNVGLMSSTSKQVVQDVLENANLIYRLDQILAGGQVVTSGNQSWVLWAKEITSSGDILLIASDVSEEQKSNENLMLFALAFALGSGVFAVFVGVGLLWRPVNRIALHSSTLPLLADGEYEKVRQRLHNMHSGYRNEVDQLDSVTIDLSRRLEFLSREVELRTGELERLAMYDTLTHLPNRSLFIHELREAIQSIEDGKGECVGLLFIDLDAFKRINETLGHMVGDSLLVQVSRNLSALISETDTLCRLGGDEFAVICRDLPSEEALYGLLNQILVTFRQPLEIDGRKLTVTASIGVVCSSDAQMSPEDLTRRADMALYSAKDEGRNSFHFFNEQMLVDISESLELESELQRAFDQEEFCLFLQPKFNLKTGELDGFEALVRWRHPERGLVMPNYFISTMEEGDLIFQLGRWVINRGVSIIKGLEQAGLGRFKLAVNLSARQFCDEELIDHLKSALDGLPGERLELEITENVLINNSDFAALMMGKARELGITVALDDFGTGYSSLSYLRELPVDVVKLDRSFIDPTDRNKQSRHIVQSVIDLAHKLDKKVVAEGIETAEHLKFLQDSSCDSAQGFLLSRPIDEEDLPDLLAAGNMLKAAQKHIKGQ